MVNTVEIDWENIIAQAGEAIAREQGYKHWETCPDTLYPGENKWLFIVYSDEDHDHELDHFTLDPREDNLGIDITETV